MKNSQKAVALHDKGYNCCQSVACVYADKLGIDESIIFRSTEAFGLGVSGQKEICGAVTGIAYVLGSLLSSGGVENGITKGKTYKTVNPVIEQFKEKNTSIICKELLGDEGHPKLRSCQGCIEDACDLIDEFLKQV